MSKLPQPEQVVRSNVFRVAQDDFVAEISLGSGVRGASVIMSSSDLKRALGNVLVGQFAEE